MPPAAGSRFIYLLVLAEFFMPPAFAADSASSRQAFLTRYCTSCHNQKSRTAGLVLENSDPAHPAAHAKLWENVIHKLRAGEMPPPGLPQPDAASAKAFLAGISNDIDLASRRSPYAGRPVIRRLN